MRRMVLYQNKPTLACLVYGREHMSRCKTRIGEVSLDKDMLENGGGGYLPIAHPPSWLKRG